MNSKRSGSIAALCISFLLTMACLCSACNQTVTQTTSSVSKNVIEETTDETQTENAVVEEKEHKTEEKKETVSDNSVSSNSVSENSISENKVPIEYTAFDEVKIMYVISPVNVRSGPSTDYDIVTHLSARQKVEVTGQAKGNGWYQLMVDDKQAYVSNHYLSEQLVEETSVVSEQPAQAQQKQLTQPSGGGTIMVGDSRFVQMQTAVGGGGCAWVCENSKGYDWFVEKAIPRIDAAAGKGTKIVINLGVNDPGNVKKYAEMVNAKAAEWTSKGARVYYVSVNPVWENPYTTEDEVTTFNSTMPSLLSGVAWIDTHSWLVNNGYKLVDGLHYDDATYINIYNVIMGSI